MPQISGQENSVLFEETPADFKSPAAQEDKAGLTSMLGDPPASPGLLHLQVAVANGFVK